IGGARIETTDIMVDAFEDDDDTTIDEVDLLPALHFIYAMVDMTVAARVSVQNCKALEPHSLIDGGRRYNFAVGAKSNNILFANCEASEGRHAFVSNGTSSVSGIVWHNCTSDGDYSVSEGHRRWSQALLFDNITFTNPNTNRLIGLYNRGNFGTGHGWSATSSVAWNIKMPSSNTVIIQQPPNRQNYGMACQGMVSGQGPFLQPQGYIEDSGSEPLIASLYEKQLANRLANGAPVDAPARFLVEQINDDIVVSWLDIADDESSYIIEVSYDGIAFEDLVELAANDTSYTFPISQLANESFYLRMYAYSKTRCPSAYTYAVFSDAIVHTRDLNKDQLRILPNPVVHFLEIKLEDESLKKIQLFGLDGKLIPAELSANQQLNLSGLQAGVYFIKIELTNGTTATRKFVKI
ncbi:MAG: T9SS type A sorting domain-containing protein, partial [Bacteroidota bacterium]